MTKDADYLAKYRPNTLYTHPGKDGVYATIAGEGEDVIGEFDVTVRCKIAVSAFWVLGKSDFGTFKITKLTYHKTHGWREDSCIHVNNFRLAQIKQFLSIISNLNFSGASKAKISLENINIDALGALLTSSKGPELIRELAKTPELHYDIYAVAAKRNVLAEFEAKLGTNAREQEWQSFFETNPWIFGHGLHYISLDKANKTLAARTTGNEFDQSGKTADGLLRTRAEISQFVVVEIKRDSTDLLRQSPYRPGCWGVSDEVSNAVTQVQKTAFEFARQRFRTVLKDGEGNDTRHTVYSVEPRTFLVVGNTSQLNGNDDKIACFELYRRNIRAPEILTFDELFYRASFIVQNLSQRPE